MGIQAIFINTMVQLDTSRKDADFKEGRRSFIIEPVWELY